MRMGGGPQQPPFSLEVIVLLPDAILLMHTKQFIQISDKHSAPCITWKRNPRPEKPGRGCVT